jgi:hypothetical protein
MSTTTFKVLDVETIPVRARAIRLGDVTYRELWDFLGWPDDELDEGESWNALVGEIEVPTALSTQWASRGDWIITTNEPHAFIVRDDDHMRRQYRPVNG